MSSSNHQGECPSCGGPNFYSAFNCGECGARLPWADAVAAARQQNAPHQALGSTAPVPGSQSLPASVAPSISYSAPATSFHSGPQGVLFRKNTPAEIELYARSQLQGEKKAATKGNSQSGCMFAVGFIALFIPVIGWPFVLMGFGGGLYSAVSSSFSPSVSAQELAGRCYQMRHMVTGNCPVCQAEVMIWPPDVKETVSLACPTCHTPLKLNTATIRVAPG